jgi:hypothetical protein
VAHFGAARDEAVAKGGSAGSLFTRLFYHQLVETGHESTYQPFLEELRDRVPARHPPVAEYVGGTEPTMQIQVVGSPKVEAKILIADDAKRVVRDARKRPNGDDLDRPDTSHFASRQSVLQI